MAKSLFKTFRLPDIHCPFPLTYHEHGDEIAAASDRWFETSCRGFTEDKRRRLYGLKAGQLTAYCYDGAEDDRLRVVCDFMNFLFHLDDLSDDLKARDTVILSDIVMNAFASPHSYRRILPDGRELPEDEPEASKLAREYAFSLSSYLFTYTHQKYLHSYWSRCIRDAGPGMQARYRGNMENFFKSIESEANSRDSNSLPSIETYMILRRDNSGCQPCFDFIEYALGFDLPDFVINDHIFQTLVQCANDFISLSNVSSTVITLFWQSQICMFRTSSPTISSNIEEICTT